uniref:energy transducer TonB n=1 Tax=Parerythrobacter lutipelagi TaxID=1964208 RepID=UPI0010F47E2C|nr:energy transducer TonB [Parerythrobacter lutipelagi]
MAYVDQKGSGSRAAGIAGVVAIHAALGAIVVTGLSTVIPELMEDKPLPGYDVEVELPPPPPTDEPEVTKDDKQMQQDIYVPDRPFEFDSNVDVSTSDIMADPNDFVVDPDPIGAELVDPFPKPTPTQEPKFDPIIAKASNNPGEWVTNADYKSSWIRREYQGVVGFSLQVSAQGRVTDCRVTRSSGHSVLDDATCRLVKQRARFTAARDGKGMKTPGSYSNSVRWELPD